MIKRTEPGTAAITSRQSKYFRAIFRPSDADLMYVSSVPEPGNGKPAS